VDTVETFESLNDKAQALAEGQLFSGDPAVVAKLTPADLRAFHQAWLRPDKAKIFVTSNLPLEQVQAMLDTAFGHWAATGQGGAKTFPANSRPAQPQIVLVDRPDSPQSYVLAAYPNRLDPAQDAIPVQAANQALGGDFLSRLNMDLREEKHWTYGMRGRFQTSQHAMPYVIAAPVQADRTGDSITALRADLGAFLTQKPMTAPELARTVAGEIRSLPGSFANSETVLDAMQHNDLLGRPDDYYAHVAARYRSLTLEEANTAIRGAIDPASGIWIVVGDSRIVAPS
jgi:predicted Zn-dependent peptidase